MAAPYAVPVEKNTDDILNYCTKYLSRGVKLFGDQPSANAFNLSVISESWRFPIVIPSVFDDTPSTLANEVTFIYKALPNEVVHTIEVVGSFAPLYLALALFPIIYEGANTGYYYLTIILPIGKGYFYRFRVNGNDLNDPINPQTKTFRNGKLWSYFFTDYYNYSQDFEEWEMNLLFRLVQQIAPFRTQEAQNFINRFYLSIAKTEKETMPIYKLDESVGEINYITNILAREERHHLQDYKICISLIDQLLRQRNPVVNSWEVSEEMINDLYNEMASGNVNGWDMNLYSNPTFFLSLIRRHAITGAFSHPKYGGNIGGVGWKYLQDKFPIKDASAQIIGSYFNWQPALEKPLGTNSDYKG